jgi:hypothetical protein
MKLLRTVALSSALMMAPVVVHAALDKTGADWVATVADNYIDAGPASESLAMVDFLLCIMENSNSGNHVNETYGSMVDENLCDGIKATTPAFSSQVMTTSRATNTDPYMMKSWFTTDEGHFIVVEASVTSAPTDAAPRGVSSLTWNRVDENGNGDYKSKGMLVLTDDSVDNIKYIESSPNGYEDGKPEPTMLTTYIHGTLDGDGTAGRLRVQTQDYQNAIVNQVGVLRPTPLVYKYVFDANNAHYKTGDTSVCLDRSPANMTKRVYGYKLFNEAGAVVEIAGPFDFRYIDNDAQEQRGWAAQSGAWLQGGEDDDSGKARPTTITRNSNNKKFNACWDDNDNGIDNNGSLLCGKASDGIFYQLTPTTGGDPYTFEDPISMVAAEIEDTLSKLDSPVDAATAWAYKADQFAKYRGGISTFELPWQCLVDDDWRDDGEDSSSCSKAKKWRQKYALADGFEFTDQSNDKLKYYVKAVDTKQTPAVADKTDCDSLALSTAPTVLGSYEIPDITGTVIWGIAGAGVPSVVNGGLTEALKMKVIHGVEQ